MLKAIIKWQGDELRIEIPGGESPKIEGPKGLWMILQEEVERLGYTPLGYITPEQLRDPRYACLALELIEREKGAVIEWEVKPELPPVALPVEEEEAEELPPTMKVLPIIA